MRAGLLRPRTIGPTLPVRRGPRFAGATAAKGDGVDHDDAATDRAIRLLRFLAEVTPSSPGSHGEPGPRGDRDARGGGDGHVVGERVVARLDSLLDHPAIHLGELPELLSVAPLPRRARPVVPVDLMPWISGDPDRPSARLRLRAKATTTAGWNEEDAEAVPVVERIVDRPDIRALWEEWHADWQEWSRVERADAPAADLHTRLSRLVEDLDSPASEFEVVLGLGLLDRLGADGLGAVGSGGAGGAGVLGAGSAVAERHMFTVPLRVRREASGLVRLSLDPHRRGLEVDPTTLATAPDRADAITVAARAYAGPLDDGQALAELLAAAPPRDGSDRDSPESPPVPLRPAPTALVRHRSSLDATTLNRVADGIERTRCLPTGLRTLVGRTPSPAPVTTPGALLVEDDVALCPWPLTPAQRQVVEAVDTHAQALVHAAPGRVRTDTIAALVTHLLAQGRRVLVTGPAESSLHEVATTIPASMAPLVVATTEDRSAAATIDTVTSAFVEHSRSGEAVARASERLAELLTRRDKLAHEAVLNREDEVREHTVAGRTGTLAALARQHLAESEFSALARYVSPAMGEAAPLTSTEAARLRALLLDPTLRRLSTRFHGHRPELDGMPGPSGFARLVTQLEAAERAGGHAIDTGDPRWTALSHADPVARCEVRTAVADILATVCDADNSDAWATTAVRDIAHGNAARWHELGRALHARLTAAVDAVEAIGTEVTVLAEVPDLPTRIDYLREHLDATGPLIVGETGIPRLGVQVPDPVRIGHVIFMNLRVNGAPPVTIEALDTLTAYLAAGNVLDELDEAWPCDTVIPLEISPRARLAWHVGLVRRLLELLDLTDRIAVAAGLLTDLGLPEPDWSDPLALDDLARMLAAADAEDATRAAAAPLTDLARRLGEASATSGAPEALRDLEAAARAFDVDGYARAWDELTDIASHADELDEIAGLSEPLQRHAPRLLSALTADPSDPTWRVLDRFEQAWDHGIRDAWLTDRIDVDPNVLAAELALVERELVTATDQLGAARAWAAAAVPDRLPASTRVDLALCAHLSRRLAGGHGSPRQHAELDRVRVRCRAAVPAWIVPLHRLTEQFDLPDDLDHSLFDVVIVQDASDIGTEANLLRALAPRIVLFGDRVDLPDRRAGQSGQAGRDRRAEQDDPIRATLAEKYLAGDPHRSSWENPRRSLFGDARLRGGARISLDVADTGMRDKNVPRTAGGLDADGTHAGEAGRTEAEVVDYLRAAIHEHGYHTRVSAIDRDLTVVGLRGELDVVFEGETWDGANAYLRDLAEQRRVERDGRLVHRIREAAFLLDPTRELSALLRALDRAGIRPPRVSHDEAPPEAAAQGAVPESGAVSIEPMPVSTEPVATSGEAIAHSASPVRRGLGLLTRRR